MSQRQHYVPQFYLRGWVPEGEGLIWVYTKTQQPRRLSIRKAGQEPDFYAFTDRHGINDSVSIEKELEKLDTAAAPVIKRIREREPLTDVDRELLSRFISVLWRRVPEHREVVDGSLRDMMPEYFEHLRDELKTLRSEKENAERIERVQQEVNRLEKEYMNKIPAYFFTENLQRPSMFETLLVKMDWAFLQAKSDTPFLTSDNPVVYSRGTGLGDLDNGIVLFPLSKDLMFQGMWKSSFRNSYVSIRDSDARRFNRYVVENAYKQVYASSKSSGVMALVSKRMRDGAGVQR
jgi:hypothetical protein